VGNKEPTIFRQLGRELRAKGGEPKVQRDPALFRLIRLVEGVSGGNGRHSPRKRRFPAVNVAKHADVDVQDRTARHCVGTSIVLAGDLLGENHTWRAHHACTRT
jgi:hypothetical protein